MAPSFKDDTLYQQLLERTGPIHLRQRLGIESESEHKIFHKGRKRFHIENIDSLHTVIRLTLRLLGLYHRGRRNALNIQIRHNTIMLPHLPAAFDGFTILQLSDLHLDMNRDFPSVLSHRLQQVNCDLCIMTGDYRFLTWGPSEAAMQAMAEVRPHISSPVYAVLGNHDSIRMTPVIEALDIKLLLNESAVIERDGDSLYLAGVDDAHYFRADNLDRACHLIPHDAVSLLLSHTPEIYRQAAHAGFDAMFCGHTHGGQIRLPGGFALTYNAHCPRHVCAGAWRHSSLQGYTSAGTGSSIVDLRYNCPPEITVHRLQRG